jgi:uncharacterized protein (DUF1499 family)
VRRADPGKHKQAEINTIYVDLATLAPPSSPNNWLVAPPDFTTGNADQAAPVFDRPADQLARAWMAVIDSQPRTTVLGIFDDGLQIEAQQRSVAFGFIDRISTRVIPLASGRSTLIAYSRSLAGYWDLGVNRSRLRRWLGELTAQVQTTAQ